MRKPVITILLITSLIFFTIYSATSVNMDQQEKSRIQAIIRTGYTGDYTLNWAKTHDFSESEKEKWVNAKKYSSSTRYLVWVSIAYQRLNVFSGSAGKWTLQKTFIIGTGAPGRETPTGIWKTTAKNPKGWSTSKYTVKPVVTFINEKYGFHSRLYCPGSTKLYDGRIGFPCSHGCIRMFTDDVAWFYEHIPLGTTVVVS